MDIISIINSLTHTRLESTLINIFFFFKHGHRQGNRKILFILFNNSQGLS